MTTTSSTVGRPEPPYGERRPATPEQVRALQGEWAEGQTVRSVDTSLSSSGTTAAIWLEHRNQPDLVFRLELNGDGSVVSFAIRPAVFAITFDVVWDDNVAGGERTVAKLEVDEESVPDASPQLTATLLRTVPLDQLRLAATQKLRWILRAVGSQDLPKAKRYRRSSLSDLDLTEFAEAWVSLVNAEIKNPAERLTDRFHLSYNGVIYRRRQAVTRGLMTGATRQGLTGGAALTEKALELLKEREKSEKKEN